MGCMCLFQFWFPQGTAGEGNGNPLQYSCLENPMDRGAWWAAVHSISKSQTQLERLRRDGQTFLLFGIKLPPKIWLHFESYLKIQMNALYQILSSDGHVCNCCPWDGLLFWRDPFGATHLGLTVRGEPHRSLCAAHCVCFSSSYTCFIPSENPSLSAC